MNKRSTVLSMLLCLIILSAVKAQVSNPFEPLGSEIGVYYYPEQWPEDQWERDIKQIADLGFEFVHYAEFAWTKMEPTEGQYDFEWLDKAVDLADKNGLKVIMCTPSPCVPAWLATKHPEVLLVQEDGRRIYHNGSRLTASLANPIYQDYISKIVEQLGKRYGDDDRIWGWQIGNEPHLQTLYDYSPSSEANYVSWLKDKYGNLETLNSSWGGEFWSYTITDWEQIKAPNPSMPGVNPHARLDFQRYTSQEVANDLDRQANQLRDLVKGDQWITTNYAYFKFLSNVDPFLTRESLDFSSHTMYLTSNWLNSSGDPLAHRLGSGMELSFSQEFAESTHGFTGIMELQPGQINWGKINAMPLPGAVRMWVWHAFALGDEFICNYRFRQPLFGSEQTHHGVMMTDGVTVNRGGEEFVQAMNEIKEVEKELDNKSLSDYIESTRTAFLMSYDNLLDMDNHKHHADWDSWQHIYTYYQGLKRMGVEVDFVRESDTFNPKTHPFMVVPAYQILDEALIAKFSEYEKKGGHLVISTRTGIKNKNGHLWEKKLQEPIWELIGGEISYYDHLPGEYPGQINLENVKYQWHTWGTIIEPFEGTESWAVFDDQFYKGKSAIIHNSKKGSTTYIGAWSDNWELEYHALRKLYGSKLNREIMDLPPYVFIENRDGIWVAVNYTNQVYDLNKVPGIEWRRNDKNLRPGDVALGNDD